MTKTTAITKSLADVVGVPDGNTHTYTNRKGHNLTIELIPGGLVEIARFQALGKKLEQPDVLEQVLNQFLALVGERAVSLERNGEMIAPVSKENIEDFFLIYSPNEVFEVMGIMVSGVKPDPKALELGKVTILTGE